MASVLLAASPACCRIIRDIQQKTKQLILNSMGHCVTALIAQSRVVESLLQGRSLVAADLRDGWQLIPLEDDDLDSLGLDFSQVAHGFTYLSRALIEFCADLSQLGPLVYFETDYFGGMGTQGAAAFSGGSIAPSSPLTGNGAINSTLRSVGVTSKSGVDVFDYIGLSRHRHTSDWKEIATGCPYIATNQG